jgi:MFS family permease
MMMLAALFFTVGFTMIGFVRGFMFFLLAVMIATIGEMILFPTNKALAINFAPPEMRGRYMAIYDFGWTIPATFGPAAAGLILDNYNPNLLWAVGGALCALSAISFYALHLWLGRQGRFVSAPLEQKVSTTA